MSLFYEQDTKDALNFDIVIVGGGMVGACLAALLGEAAKTSSKLAALKVRVLENSVLDAPWQAGFDPRVSAITVASQRVLENVGAWPLMVSHRVSPFRKMDVWDAEGTGSIQFYAEDLGETRLGHIVENRVIQKALLECCRHYPQIEILSPEQLVKIEKTTPDVSLLLGSHRTVRTKLLVGADGANSFVRDQLRFSLQVSDYHQSAIVTTIKTEKSHEATAWQRFTPTGPIAFLPLSDDGRYDQIGGDQPGDGKTNEKDNSSLVWSTSPAESRDLLALTDEAFSQKLTQAFEGRLGQVEWCDKRFSYPLKQRHVSNYIQDNVALIGDAAHTIHPLAGQGVNLGFMDAAVLAEEICQAMEAGLSPGIHGFLRRFERRRKGPNLAMMTAMGGFKQLFSAEDLSIRMLRNTGMSLMNQASPIKNHIMAQAMGLSGDLPLSAKPKLESDLLY